jgi:phosphomannomutase
LSQPVNAVTPNKEQNRTDSVHFGTDGWRAIIDEDFNPRSVARVADAAARVFREHTEKSNTIVIGYDCRLDAERYAVLAATVVASHGFDVVVSDRYCPTPALCWTLFRDPQAVGGLMLTSSHNPAEWLGIKLRMADGGASPQSFTNRVEAALRDELPACFDEALARFAAATSGTPDAAGAPVAAPGAPGTPAAASGDAAAAATSGTLAATGGTPSETPAIPGDAPATPLPHAPHITFANITAPYLTSLASLVDREAIAAAGLRVVVDPLYGAGRGYLARLLRDLGVEVVEVNGDADPSFNGLHPEPIMPWVQEGAAAVRKLGYDACFVTDGDADRIGALDEHGTYVTSHRILALLIGHLVENREQTGRVVRTQAGSNLLRRQCDRLGLTLTTKPIGFKWIYEEMLKGDVLIGGEESGGMGIPTHVRERDGLLMALLLTELMAQTDKKLHQLVADLLTTLGTLEYNRRDLRLTPRQMEALLTTHVAIKTDSAPADGVRDATQEGGATQEGDVNFFVSPRDAAYGELFAPLGEKLIRIDRTDGIKFDFASDAWLLVRPSGTEPLVRVYAEAATPQQVEALLDTGCALAQGD